MNDPTGGLTAIIFIGIYAAGVALGLFCVGLGISRKWIANSNVEAANDIERGMTIFMVVIWPLLAFAALVSIPIFGPFYGIYHFGRWVGRRTPSQQGDA